LTIRQSGLPSIGNQPQLWGREIGWPCHIEHPAFGVYSRTREPKAKYVSYGCRRDAPGAIDHDREAERRDFSRNVAIRETSVTCGSTFDHRRAAAWFGPQ
jgi:hypothetical protein